MRNLSKTNKCMVGKCMGEESERLKKYREEMEERLDKSFEFRAPFIIADKLIIKGTFEQEELFGEISDWAIIELTAIDPKVGSSVSVKLGLLDSQKLRKILESKEILGEEWNKKQAEIVDKRKERQGKD